MEKEYKLMPWKRAGERDILLEHTVTLASKDRLPLLKFPLLESCGIVQHCFTTRAGGVSGGEWSSLNLSFSRGDEQIGRAHV